jgi:O-acetyl-ADP-ribose deacetylase (regulator of RNase III)
MMIALKTGDILAEDVEALVNTVNCVGVMGRGIALQFKRAFPDNFRAYVAACKRQEVRIGQMFFYEPNTLQNPKYIINFPTKYHWRSPSRLEYIEAGLDTLVKEVNSRQIRSLAIPPLGCGLGGLSWDDVKPRILEAVEKLEKCEHVVIFEPDEISERRFVTSPDKPKMTPGRAALIGLIDRYLKGLLDPFVTLLEVHKLMYFMQEVVGEDLRLRYKPAPYGPYADNLRPVLRKIEGHFLVGYGDGGEEPDRQITLLPGALEQAQQRLATQPETLQRFEHVSSLIEGFESSFGLELLSTVHWVMQESNSYEEVIKRTYAWGERKKQFTERQIRLAVDVLTQKNLASLSQ